MRSLTFLVLALASAFCAAEDVVTEKCGKNLQLLTVTGDSTACIQAALKARGFSPGKVDGVVGPNTEAAIRTFKNSNGLASSGEIDAELIEKLKAGILSDSTNIGDLPAATLNPPALPEAANDGAGLLKQLQSIPPKLESSPSIERPSASNNGAERYLRGGW